MIQNDKTIIADKGKTFRRLFDGFIMGNEILLDMDFSTGEMREDLPEYYEEIDEESNTEDTIEEKSL